MVDYSGRSDRRGHEFQNTINLEEEQLDLLNAIARSTTIRKPAIVTKVQARYSPIYKHPLPISERRFNHELILNRVLSCKTEDQAAAAITACDPWVLEEVFMRGAPVEHPCSSGYRPIHIAVQKNQFECLMVLFNIGINVNVTTVSGVTPLYLAYAAQATQAIQLLLEKGAKLNIDPMRIAPGATVLELDMKNTQPDKVADFVGLPRNYLTY